MATLRHYYLPAVVLLSLWFCASALQGLSCDVTDMRIKIEPVVRAMSAERSGSNSDAGRKVSDVMRHDEIGAVSNEKVKDADSVFLTIKPKKNGIRNAAYPEEGFLNINAVHVAKLICFPGNTMRDIENMTSQLQDYFGLHHNVMPLGLDDKKEEELFGTNTVAKATDGFKFSVMWNISDFKMSALDLKTITHESGITSLPFYVRLFGGDSLQQLDTDFAYIREHLRFKSGSSDKNIRISYKSTKWRFKLYAPFVSDHLDYRISLISSHGNTCNKTLNKGEKALYIYCENDIEKGILMNENIQLLFHVFQNYVPNHLFRIILGYSDVFSNSPRAQTLLSWLSRNLINLLMLYTFVIVFCQILPFVNLESKICRSLASSIGLTAYLVLYCPCILMTTDVQESVALMYMFYIDVIAWDIGVYWLLCIAWILYPGVMCLLGLLPAVLHVSDIKVYGHFHCFLRSKNCPETCPDYEIDDPEENPKKNPILEEKIHLDNNPWKIPNFSPDRKNPLENENMVVLPNVSGYPQEKITDTKISLSSPKKRSRVNLCAILCEIVGLVHRTVYLFSMQCLYFIVTGLFPLYNFLAVVMVLVAMEIFVLYRRK